MQNIAQAYRQTQAETVGQGELVVMLYDGALRFLAQAREKIMAKDYAAKGILLSRALDIINELDSSLNMEVGGELTKNLHQLYFLCTTRLLQANLKLDIAQLDSVVTILSGLRDAFAQVVSTPEARAACAQISAKQATKQAASSPRPVMTAPAHMMAPRSAVAGLYSQQSNDKTSMAPPAAVQPAQAVPGRAAAPASGQGVMPTRPAPLTENVTAQISPEAPQVPAPQPAPQTAPQVPPASGFANKRLALYGKIQQGR